VAKSPVKPTDERPSFDTALTELEGVVSRMEDGNLSLEESLHQFEQGVRLTRICQEALSQAEQKVKILLSDEQGESLQPFAPIDEA
jgi:exodeoxyribonuclease VII small subunit